MEDKKLVNLLECILNNEDIYPSFLEMRDFRVRVGNQIKASLAVNGYPLAKVTTQSWFPTHTPVGQGDKHSSSAL